MSDLLIKKLRAARTVKAEVNGHTFTCMRPTEGDILKKSYPDGLSIIEDFVVDWDLKEEDIINSGSSDIVPFSKELWIDWVSDHAEVWEPLSSRILDEYQRYKEKKEDSAKN